MIFFIKFLLVVINLFQVSHVKEYFIYLTSVLHGLDDLISSTDPAYLFITEQIMLSLKNQSEH